MPELKIKKKYFVLFFSSKKIRFSSRKRISCIILIIKDRKSTHDGWIDAITSLSNIKNEECSR